MSSLRASELDHRLDELRRWGTLTVARLWAQMDVEDVRGSFLVIYPALVEAHRVQVIEALEAVDRYMFLVAADDGLLYERTWRSDQPGRPMTTGSGRNAAEHISRTPYVVLRRIGRGRGPAQSMQVGLNYLARLFGSEPHRVGRSVPWSRFEDDQLEQMAAG